MSRGRRKGVVGALLIAAFLATPGLPQASDSQPAVVLESSEAPAPQAAAAKSRPDEFHLTSSVLGDLAQLQQDWSTWLAAYELNDLVTEEEALERMVETTRGLGMRSLPELSLGAAARAVEAARRGDARRAQRALSAARVLDPGQAEIAFAMAAMDRLEGDWGGYVLRNLQGYTRTLADPLQRRLWLHNGLLWLLTTLMLAGCAFVAVLMWVRGPALFGSLLKVVRKVMPVPVGIGAIILLLLWPVALSTGVLAVALNWSILLWAYCERAERWVLGALFLLFGLAPIALDEQQRQIAVDLSPVARAAESAGRGELRGSLFGDLQRLAVLLPESTAVRHLMADQHRRVGQCDQAKELYQQVVRDEVDNAAAWVDYGSCYLVRGEFDQAIEHYRRATGIDETLAEGHFNLALAYSELYRFSESGLALRRAQQIDSSKVAQWLDETPQRGFAEVGRGLDRTAEVRRDLRESWVLEDDVIVWSSPWEDYLSLPAALLGLVLALVAGRFMPRAHLEAMAPPLVDWGSRWAPLYRVLVPGLPEIEAGESMQSLLALLVPIGLLLVPWVGAYGYRLSWGLEPSMSLGWVLMAGGLVLFIGWRWRKEVEF